MNELFKCRPIAKAIAHNVHRNYMVGNIIREKGFIYQIQKIVPPYTHTFLIHYTLTLSNFIHSKRLLNLCFTQNMNIYVSQNVNTKHYVINSNRLILKQIRPAIERISGDKKIIKMAHNPASAV